MAFSESDAVSLYGAVVLSLAPSPRLSSRCALDQGRVTEIQDPYVGFHALYPLFERNASTDRYEIAASRLALFYPDSFAAQKSPREFRIFCSGGSTVQGSPYTIETSFTTWLELSLQAADPSSALGSGQLRRAVVCELPPRAPSCKILRRQADLIIVYAGQNEFLEDRSYAQVETIVAHCSAHACLAFSAAHLQRQPPGLVASDGTGCPRGHCGSPRSADQDAG